MGPAPAFLPSLSFSPSLSIGAAAAATWGPDQTSIRKGRMIGNNRTPLALLGRCYPRMVHGPIIQRSSMRSPMECDWCIAELMASKDRQSALTEVHVPADRQ
ncbi:hypothetical protein ASPBRDRAFT_45710 [Aspergillus brasiliensis CBS 101740]|uniref:Uncharacterized protein n=1 Tax=Aspergillus brasiliensis (strain CBS 101740 / IMI 381727 / IBT 21946) TaxID=767769 RepID=A0A1L9UCI5_ASPBC|nr:hypothetical protein ASPBRDRAFT_45710 [Aspergillus brasiliensis CBS 101740]